MCAPISKELVSKVKNMPELMNIDAPTDSSLHGALTRFFSQPLVGKCCSRQIFVLTPGQLRGVTQTLDLCQDNSSRHRIFTFALGNNPNHGLVEGMAELTGGHCVYVEERDRDNLTELLMRELRTSFMCSICDVTIDVDGRDDIELARYPNPPVAVNGSNNFMLRSGSKFENGQCVLVRGRCRGEIIDIPLTCAVIQDNPQDVFPFHRLFGALFAHQRIRMLEHRIRAMPQSKEKDAFVDQVIILSKESGVLSDHTSFIGASEAHTNVTVHCCLTVTLMVRGSSPKMIYMTDLEILAWAQSYISIDQYLPVKVLVPREWMSIYGIFSRSKTNKPGRGIRTYVS